jgi:hypothetical protein
VVTRFHRRAVLGASVVDSDCVFFTVEAAVPGPGGVNGANAPRNKRVRSIISASVRSLRLTACDISWVRRDMALSAAVAIVAPAANNCACTGRLRRRRRRSHIPRRDHMPFCACRGLG